MWRGTVLNICRRVFFVRSEKSISTASSTETALSCPVTCHVFADKHKLKLFVTVLAAGTNFYRTIPALFTDARKNAMTLQRT